MRDCNSGNKTCIAELSPGNQGGKARSNCLFKLKLEDLCFSPHIFNNLPHYICKKKNGFLYLYIQIQENTVVLKTLLL